MDLEVSTDEREIAAWCKRWKIAELSLGGSAPGDEGACSELEVLVEFEPHVHMGLLGFARLSSELEEMLGRRVDVVAEKGH